MSLRKLPIHWTPEQAIWDGEIVKKGHCKMTVGVDAVKVENHGDEIGGVPDGNVGKRIRFARRSFLV